MIKPSLIILLLVFFLPLTTEAQGIKKDKRIDLGNGFFLGVPLSKTNVLYTGIDNKIVLYKNGKPTTEYNINTNNGNAFPDSAAYLIIPSKSGDINVWFYEIPANNKNDTIYYAQVSLKVFNFPKPELTINGKNIGKMDKLKKSFLMEADSIGLHLTNDIVNIDEWYEITSFTFGYIYGRHYISYKNSDKYFSEKSKHAIKNLLPGYEISIRLTIRNKSNVTIIPPLYRAEIF